MPPRRIRNWLEARYTLPDLVSEMVSPILIVSQDVLLKEGASIVVAEGMTTEAKFYWAQGMEVSYSAQVAQKVFNLVFTIFRRA